MSNRIKPYWLISSTLFFMAFSAAGQTTTSQNYVMTNMVKQSGVTTESGVNALAIATQGKVQTVEYIDGLGRSLQTVMTQGSATQHDLITGKEYDVYGREVKKYLPYADLVGTTPGAYRPAWNAAQSSFYAGTALPNVDADVSPFSLSAMEASPLNRPLAQGAPGSVWQPNLANPYDVNAHSVQLHYLANLATDNVRLFRVDAGGNITSTGFYPDGTLYLTVTMDEQQQTTKEFKDIDGHVLLKRVYNATDVLETYYIYDDFQLLRAVIQPEGTVALAANSWVFPTGFAGQWMFLYRYDQRKRMVMKEVPGADSVNMVYDQWDRLVLSQDGNQRVSHFWIFTKYDQLNRPVVTGQITDTRALSAVQTDATNATGRFETVSTSATEGYTLNATFPSSSSYVLTILGTQHFDDYSNLPSWGSLYAFINEYGIAAQNNFCKGQKIASQACVLGTSAFYRIITYCDDKYRQIQSTEDNAAGGKDRMSQSLTFDGKPTNDYLSHTSRFYTTAHVTKQVYSYDPVDRLLTVTHQVGSQEVTTLTQNAYNEVGQLLNKKIHQAPSHPTALQKIDYYYNIRGWISNINKPLPYRTGYEEGDFFSEELHYGTVGLYQSVPQFNGNIAESYWKGGYDEYDKSYAFTYDGFNQLWNSNYLWGAASGGNVAWNGNKKYNEAFITYDHNGNLLTLSRYHGDYAQVDELHYLNYNGNKLGHVDDWSSVTSPVGFQDKNNGGDDYTYDANGNMLSDYNKGITAISYNYLNLPNVVTIPGKGTITYTYDAAGTKLQKTTVDQTISPNKTTNYYYAGDYVYRNDTLEFISHAEGRLRPVRIDTTQPISTTNLKYLYDYYLKDHLGNVRNVLSTEQETDLYAVTEETAAAAKEDALFANVSSSRFAKPPGFDANGLNAQVSRLSGDPAASDYKRVGPSIVLKVMAGDTISIGAYGWYTGTVKPPPGGTSTIVADLLLPLLTSGVIGDGGTKGGAIPTTNLSSPLTTDLGNLLTLQNSYDITRPKAFLNWMVVDEEFAAVSSLNHSGALQIPVINTGMPAAPMVGPQSMVIRRNGYLYVYLSNESKQDVYFDNLVITHNRGPLVEQKDFYPFGMEIPGLSTQALKYQYYPNRYKFNGGNEVQNKEFNDGSGLELYDAHNRMYDPQIGRFGQIDPYADVFSRLTPYSFANNDPVLLNDPNGLLSDSGHPQDLIPVETHHQSTKILYVIDNSPTTKNPNFKFGTNTPFFVHYELNAYNPAAINVSDQLAEGTMIAYSAIPIVGQGISGLYKLLKRIQDLKRVNGIPQRIQKAAQDIRNGAARPGIKGGRNFANDGRGGGERLPDTNDAGEKIDYKEYDVNPSGTGGRDAERIVTGNDKYYYTDNHYQTFREIK